MNCQEIKNLMDAYLDGELDPITSQKVEQHLRDCPKCEQAYEMETAMAHAISQAAPYYKAPPELLPSGYRGNQGVRQSRDNHHRKDPLRELQNRALHRATV